jgi:hypothetical protein
MALQSKESSYIQAVSNRWDLAMPHNMAGITPSATEFAESVLYIDAEDTLTFTTAAGQIVTATFGQGFIPVRVVKVTAQTGSANIYRLY